jgi:predicted DNA-binding transcriptional regulator AlpA
MSSKKEILSNRTAAIRFLKSSEEQKTLLPLALKNCVIEEAGEAGAVLRRAPSLEEVIAALKAYFRAVDASAAVEPVAASPRCLRVDEAAKALGIAKVTCRLWMRKGKLRKVKLSPGVVGVLASDIHDFLAKARGD